MPTTQIVYDCSVAAAILRDGGLVAFPTETVYGLGADATNQAAIQRLFLAKGRPSDNPLIVHLAAVRDWRMAASELTESAKQLLAAFSPGPLTTVLPKSPKIVSSVTGGLNTVGIRIPFAPLALELIAATNLPIAAPSANLSGRPSCTTWQAVLEDLDGRIDAVLAGPPCGIGLESSVVDCTSQHPILLRAGGISLTQLQQVIAEARALPTTSDAAGIGLASPGLRHPHYQPTARVILVGEDALAELPQQPSPAESAYCGLTPPPDDSTLAYIQLYPSVEDYARGYYEFLRETDRRHLRTAFVELVSPTEIGGALRDRQQRSAAREL
ncbi:L-threonylcarbamoyladenylate synthase [Aureliella helgolandensis]|uniref:Threonylcarbamoyl-AMP synthase n=1 Tax=Aureliella helgolandensis TaxID=2527968 RepID=A0A518G6Q9_9BACT|nr:L-threonylcarbamoyladenylate synthase [Aureliella helgolandensis]QDV24277.1 Threonylcarbamoyl-AMP synthase [Aureliella helgolandensis]